MASRSMPGMGLQAYWNPGEDGWDPGMNTNLRTVSVLAQLSVKNQDLVAAPGSPTNGDIHIVGQGSTGTWAGQDGKIAVYDANAWVFLDALTGLIAYVEDEGLYYRYDAGWAALVQPVSFSAYCDYRFVLPSAGTWAKIPTNVARHNDQAAWASGTGLFTAPDTGYYHLGAAWTYGDETNDPSYLGVGLGVEGADPTADARNFYTASSVEGQTSVACQAVLKLVAGDTVEAMAFIATNDGAVVADSNCFWGFKL